MTPSDAINGAAAQTIDSLRATVTSRDATIRQLREALQRLDDGIAEESVLVAARHGNAQRQLDTILLWVKNWKPALDAARLLLAQTGETQ